MRILVVAPMVPRARAPGAIPLVLDAMLQGLREHHAVSLVTVVEAPEQDLPALDELRASGIDVHGVPRSGIVVGSRWKRRWQLASSWLRGQDPFRSAWFWDPGVQREIDRLLTEGSFDVVNLEDNASGAYRIPRGVPVVLTEYEVRRARPINWRGALRGPRRRWWLLRELDWLRWPAYQRRVWRAADRVQVLTPRDAASVRAIAPDIAERMNVNPFAVRLPSAPLDVLHEEPRTILFVGSFWHPPNVDAALWLGSEIMPLLRQRCPGVRLLLVGPDPPAEVRALAGQDIDVTGVVPAVEPYFERAAIVLAPIRTGGGQRMKVLQAMALGKAVVTTPRGAEGLSIDGEAPPLAVADGTENLVETTARLLEDVPARRALGQRARTYAVEHFSPAAYAQRLERVYSGLVVERPRV